MSGLSAIALVKVRLVVIFPPCDVISRDHCDDLGLKMHALIASFER
jgi:hypothetical protein